MIDTSDNTITTANALLYRIEGNNPFFLLAQENDGNWGLPGGAKEIEDPNLLATLQRELQEELGLGLPDYEIVDSNIRREFEYDHFKSSRFGKHGIVAFFLVRLADKAEITQSSELSAAEWFSRDEAEKKLTFDHVRDGFKQAVLEITG